MIIAYFVLHFILVVDGEDKDTVPNKRKHPAKSSTIQSTNHAVDENIFQIMETSSFDTTTTVVPSQPSKKRKQKTSHDEAITISSNESKQCKQKTPHEKTRHLSARLQSKKSRLS
jgi:hypothetical protein